MTQKPEDYSFPLLALNSLRTMRQESTERNLDSSSHLDLILMMHQTTLSHTSHYAYLCALRILEIDDTKGSLLPRRSNKS